MSIENVIKKIIYIFITFLTFSSVSMEEEKNWIFLRKINIDLPDKETSGWRILNGHLELNSNGEDAISIDTFAHLLKEAQKKDIPYILIGLRDKNSFYHFLDGSYLPILASKWENPFTRQPPYMVEIFVAGNDEKLIFLDEFDLETIKNNFLSEQNSTWHLKKNLQMSGYGHVLIANLFIQKAESINQFHYEINQEKLEIHQHAFQWLDWALKNLPPGKEHLHAQQERDRIFTILKPKSQIINNLLSKETWKIKKEFQHTTYIKNATYNESSQQIYILDEKNVTLRNVDDEKQQVILPHCFFMWKPPFDSSGNYIATGPNKKTIAISRNNGKKVVNITTENYPKIVTFNNQGDHILIAGQNNITLRNLDGTLITNYNLEPKYSIKIAKFFPNNENLIFIAPFESYERNKAKVWDIRNKNVITYDYIGPLKQASIHSEGTYLACTKQQMDGVAHMYDLRKKGNILLSNFNKPRSAKFNFSGTHILTQYYQAHLALLWKTQNITTQKYVDFNLKLNHDNLCRATFHPNTNSILTCSTKNILNKENNFSIWDFDGNQLAKLPHKKTIYSAKYDATGNYIISKHDDNIERNIGSKIVTLWQKENS